MIDWRPEEAGDRERDCVLGWSHGRPYLMRWDTLEGRWRIRYHGARLYDVEQVATIDPPNSA
jgi:hypothetical protein